MGGLLLNLVLAIGGSVIGFLVAMFFYRRAKRDAQDRSRKMEDELRKTTELLQKAADTFDKTAVGPSGSGEDTEPLDGPGPDLALEPQDQKVLNQLSSILAKAKERGEKEETLFGSPRTETTAEVARLEYEIGRLRHKLR